VKYRSEIDGLRAIAVIPVILFHAGFNQFRGGFVGVDIFFVISGYLITDIIYREILSGDFSIVKFYERRARRILPALLLVSLVCIPVAYFSMVPTDLKNFSGSLISVNLFVSNIFFWWGSGYFDTATGLKPLLHTWSLSIEEQFYIFFPISLFILQRLSRQGLMIVIGAISLSSLATAEYLSRYHPAANFYLLPSRAWELGVGALLSLATGGSRIDSGMIRQTGSFLGLGLLGFAIFAFDEATRFPSVWALFPVIGTALVIACAGGGDLVGRVLGWKPVAGVGLISYSAYLWHQPLFAFARIRSLNEPTVEFYIALIVTTFALAFLSWKFVECPFRNKRVMSIGAMTAWMTPVAFGLVAFGALGQVTNGFWFLAPDAIKSLQEKLVMNHGLSEKCDTSFTLSTECRTSNSPDVIVWGDSYAMHLVDGIVASDPNIRMIQLTKSVCGPILRLAPVLYPQYPEDWATGCNTFNNEVLAYLQGQSTIKHAIISSPFSQYVGDGATVLYDGHIIKPSVDFVADAIYKTILSLRKLGIETTVVSPPPTNGVDLGHCLAKAIEIYHNPSLCDFSILRYEADYTNVIKLFDALRAKKIRTIVLSDYLCTNGNCKTSEGNVFLYRDTGHLSKEGSSYLGKKYDFASLFTDMPNP
jgi:peptidoglycan/LPS O-acetylase OafA/YrhL